MAERLDISVPENCWPQLVEAATFEHMRSCADRIAPDTTHAIWQDNQQFFHRGVSGQWRTLLADDGLRRYCERVAELAEPDLARWLHRDPVSAS